MNNFKFFVYYLHLYLLLMVKTTTGEVIDENEYNKMPQLFTMDDFDDCLFRRHGVYCLTHIELKSSSPSPLLDQIKNFSSVTLKHYRHDILHKGICMSTTCNTTERNEQQLLGPANECINRDLEEQYSLQGNVTIQYCEDEDSRPKMDVADWAYIVIVLAIVVANVLGTFYHLVWVKDDIESANKLIMAFSFVANWFQLMKPPPKKDDGKTSLRAIQGMRFLTMNAVIFSHVALIIPYGYVRNTLKIEIPYSDPLMQLLYNGGLVVQTFFCIASFLMSYQFLQYIEKHPKPKLWLYFAMVIQRWIRLTPLYGLVLGFVITINQKMGFGPQWRHIVISEAEVCRNYWWANLLYINNYVHEAHHCMPQTWYLATDTQLFYYGAFVMMIIWKYPNFKKMLLGAAFVVALLLPGVLTYKNNYYPVVSQSPETFRTLYDNDPTFLYIYTTIAGNFGGYTIGMIMGCLQYYMEKNNISLKHNKAFFVWYYTLFPLGVLTIITGAIFYVDNYARNPLLEAVYASLFKVFFDVLIVCLLFGPMHKCDKFIRGILEWDGFRVLGKLTYCAYLLHTVPQRALIGLIRQPYDVIEYNIISVFAASITITYFLAWPICIMVEIPFRNLQKLLFRSQEKREPSNKTEMHPNSIELNVEGNSAIYNSKL